MLQPIPHGSSVSHFSAVKDVPMLQTDVILFNKK